MRIKKALIIVGVFIMMLMATIYGLFYPFAVGVNQDAQRMSERAKTYMMRSSFKSKIFDKKNFNNNHYELILLGQFNIPNEIGARGKSNYYSFNSKDTLTIKVSSGLFDAVNLGDSVMKKMSSSKLIIQGYTSSGEFSWLSEW